MMRSLYVIVAAAGLAGAGAGAGASARAEPQLHSMPIEAAPLGGGAYVVTGGISNAGFVVGRDGVIAIDAQMTPADAQAEQAAIARVTSKPVSTVILTHSDTDHLNGLPGWPKTITVIAQENAEAEMRLQLANTDPRRMSSPAEVEAYLPKTRVRGSVTTTINGVPLVLMHVAAAHTDSDLIIFLPEQRVAFMGDLLTIGDPNLPDNGPYPIIHLDKHGSSLGWIASAKAALALPVDIFIGGHGPARVDRATLQAAVTATEQRRAEIKALFDQGRSLGDIKAMLKEPPRSGPLAFFPTFVETVYQELMRS